MKVLLKTENTNVYPAKNNQEIENHKRTAAYLAAAAKYHLEAAMHYEEGNHEEAATSTIIAQRHHSLANAACVFLYFSK